MKKYSYTHVVAFRDRQTGTVVITREYNTDDEFFEIMDNIDFNNLEIILVQIDR